MYVNKDAGVDLLYTQEVGTVPLIVVDRNAGILTLKFPHHNKRELRGHPYLGDGTQREIIAEPLGEASNCSAQSRNAFVCMYVYTVYVETFAWLNFCEFRE